MHWSSRLLASHLKVGNATIARAWREYGVQPWRAETFKFLTDPQLVGKATDVVGLYLAPPENAVGLCVDAKSQIQALDRTGPMLPLRPGDAEKRTHNYLRHGMPTLFAARDVATGHVTGAVESTRHLAIQPGLCPRPTFSDMQLNHSGRGLEAVVFSARSSSDEPTLSFSCNDPADSVANY